MHEIRNYNVKKNNLGEITLQTREREEERLIRVLLI